MSGIQPGTEGLPPAPAGSLPPSRRRRTNVIILGCAGLIGLFMLLAIIGALVGGTKTTTSTATPRPTASASPSPEASESPSPVPTVAPVPIVPPPVVPSPAAPQPAALAVHITASTYGHVAATTSPGATCTASATLPSGNLSTAAGLQVAQTAGAGGTVGWTYRTTTRTGKGTGTHTVSCQLNGESASDSAPFIV